MKFFEKIITITFMCLFIFGIKNEVYAADLEYINGTLPPDDSLEEITYVYDFFMYDVDGMASTRKSCLIGQGSETFKGYKRVFFWYEDVGGVALGDFVYNSHGYVGGALCCSVNSQYSSESIGSTIRQYCDIETLEYFNDKSNATYDYLTGRIYWKGGMSGYAHFTTNVPIFADEETALAYINGTVELTQADNYEDLINISYDSTDIPTPHNLNVTEENSKYYISWSQTSEELPFISEVSYRHHIDALQITHETEGVYPTYPKKPELFYNPQLLHKYEITDEILNIVKFYREKCGVDSFKCSYVIRIRNKFVKSETEILYSNVVRAVLTISYDLNSGIKISAEYEEKTESGDFVPDSSYNDYGDGSGLIRDDIGATSVGSLSTGNFISNIVNGFGLLGNGGIVSLTASALSFIPSELWTLIYFALSLFLIIALFKLVIK